MFKKVLAVGFSAVLALSLVACGGSKDNKSKSSKETTTASESEAATVYSVKDEKIKVDSGVIKLADYSQLTVYEDDVKVTDVYQKFTTGDMDADGALVLRKGKKAYHKVKAD